MNTPTTPKTPIFSGDYGTPVSQIALGAQKTPDPRAESTVPFSALTDYSLSDDGTEASGATT
jgi:hypothetical protein